MTPEQLQELKEKAELWDSLSDALRTIFLGKFNRPTIIPNLEGEITENGKGAEQFRYGKMDCELTKEGFLRVKGTSTIENTSNASSHVGLLEEENKEMVGKAKDYDEDMKRYENSLFCAYCNNDKIGVTFIYNRTIANGEEWVCRLCNSETLVDEEPNPDKY